MKLFPICLLLLGAASSVFAGTPAVPEIDGNTGASGFALVAGSLLILRSRRNRK